ncbi:hypothetical protein EDB81DRAFT_130403 [Dactylonectria macrodidyma]|uniref:Uncharacterized protein n=1 Tax=Dactylonectria macrodidyma TaxID=307937 RepID=A0A9P9E542_9HYPO|nr:hypothetical protein EDB81DRAFT_130403 [Dactylonectria macrodidyma]
MKPGGDESFTPATQMSAADKVEAMAQQNEDPSASSTIVAEDIAKVKAHPQMSVGLNPNEDFSSPLYIQPSDIYHAQILHYNKLNSPDRGGGPQTPPLYPVLAVPHNQPASQSRSSSKVFSTQPSPSSVGVDDMHPDPSVSQRQPGSLSGEAEVKGFLTSSEAVAANLSELAIASQGGQGVHPPSIDSIPEAAQEEFRNIFAPAFVQPPENMTTTSVSPVQSNSGSTSGEYLAEFPEMNQANAICVLRNPESQYMAGMDIVDDGFADPTDTSRSSYPYLFVEYNMDDFDHDSPEEMRLLHRIAEKTARSLGLPAYWGVLGRKRSPASIRTGTQTVNDIVKFSQHFLFICRSELSHSIRGHTRTRHLGRHLCKWSSLFDSIPVLVPALAKSEFHVYSVHEDATEIVLHPSISRAAFVNMMWNDKISNAPSAFQILYNNAERDIPTLGKLEKTLCFMKLLAGAQESPSLPYEYLETVRDYCERRELIYFPTHLFDSFVGIFLSNPDLKLLERWLCIPQSKDYSAWGIKHLLGAPWELTAKIATYCQVIGLESSETIQCEGGWGHDLHFFNPSKNRSVISVFKKRTPEQRFSVAYGAISVADVQKWFPGSSKAVGFSLNTMLQNHSASMFMSHWTLIDTHLRMVTHFLAYNKPTKIILCGRDGGDVVRAMLCSGGAEDVINGSDTTMRVNPRNMLFHKENAVRIYGANMTGARNYMGRFRLSLSPGNSKETAEPSPSIGTSSRRSFAPSFSFDMERAKDRVMEHFFEI